MKNLFICTVLTIAFVSCTSKNKTPENTDLSTLESNTEKLCFLKVTQSKDNPAIRDSMSLTLNRIGDSISGNYNWLPYEKDKKTGTYTGKLTNNVAIAIYTYNAEGQYLKEELIFKLDDDAVIIKNGELQEVNGIWKFKNEVSAKYTEKLPKISCD